MSNVLLTAEQAQQIEEALANIQITGPDADGVLWIHLPGNGTTGKAILRVGKEGLIASQCAKIFNERRIEALATIRAARAQIDKDAITDEERFVHAYRSGYISGQMYMRDKMEGAQEQAKQEPAVFHRASFLSGYEAAQSDANYCDVPPQGWLCTRQAGHDGSCAAIEDTNGHELVSRAMSRLAAIRGLK